MFQNYNLVPVLNVYENIVLHDGLRKPLAGDLQQAHDVLTGPAVQISGGLIRQDDRRLRRQRAGPIQLDGGQPDKGYTNQIIETLGLGSKLQNLPNNLSGYSFRWIL